MGISQLAGFGFICDEESRGREDQKVGKLWTEAKSTSFKQHILVFMMLKVKELCEMAWKYTGPVEKKSVKTGLLILFWASHLCWNNKLG